jgi:uncharacterized phage protein gp47/JayE
MPTTLAQLTAALTPTQEQAALLAQLQSSGFPTTAWANGSVPRSLVAADAKALSSMSQLIANLANGGFLQSFLVPTTPATPSAWLDLLAASQYQLARNAPVTLAGFVVVTDAAAAGPFTLTTNQLWFAASNGLRYTNTAGDTLPKGGQIILPVQAESPGAAFNVANGAISTLVTTLAGATAANYFGEVLRTGSGAGTVIPSGVPAAPTTPWAALTNYNAGTYRAPTTANGFFYKVTTAGTTGATEPTWPTTIGGTVTDGGAVWTCKSLAAVRVKIIVGGGLGTASYQLSTDGGATFSTTLTTPTAAAPATYGVATPIGLGFSLGFAGTLVATDTYDFTAVTWIGVAGVDAESDLALATRCMNRWPSLATYAPPATAYELWAATASPNVTRALVRADPVVPGKVDIYLAGAAGPVDLATIAAVVAYITPRLPITVSALINTATGVNVTITGTVNVRAAFLVAAQAAWTTALAAYAAALPIGGTVYVSALIELLMLLPGVVSVDLPIAAPATDQTLTASQVATFTSNLTWVVV